MILLGTVGGKERPGRVDGQTSIDSSVQRSWGYCSLRMENLRKHVGIIFSMTGIDCWSLILLDRPQTAGGDEKRKTLSFETAKMRTFLGSA